MVIKGKVVRGKGLARTLGFPTVNITNDLNIQSNVYFINHKVHGIGSAIVMKDYCEIHFIESPSNVESYIECDVDGVLFDEDDPPREGLLSRVLYDGIMNERKR